VQESGVRWADRKLRLAVVLTIAVVVAVVAWRMGDGRRAGPCESGRWEEKDASGKVVKISRKECR
jgi:hypothetical protein